MINAIYAGSATPQVLVEYQAYCDQHGTWRFNPTPEGEERAHEWAAKHERCAFRWFYRQAREYRQMVRALRKIGRGWHA